MPVFMTLTKRRRGLDLADLSRQCACDDSSLTPLVEEFYHAAFLGDEGVDADGFGVEVVSNRPLLGQVGLSPESRQYPMISAFRLRKPVPLCYQDAPSASAAHFEIQDVPYAIGCQSWTTGRPLVG